ncbi:MAG: Rrf2 family transcriptional regulator [Armatimonadota bacterium]|nr:Rrf2 family transcriptional regulator [bacterium]MDW8321914.1 Rrf2 family transcriptional regulator [Armatimonadota bacterium]
MISQTAEYALRAMVYLAQYPEQSRTNQQIAQATRVPTGYLAKVLQNLSRAGLITSRRGLGGGFTLAKPDNQITIYEVVQAVDPIPRITSCPLKLKAHRHKLCPLHQRLDNAWELVEQSFRNTTLSDLIGEAGEEGVLCEE